jgi:uncharacterized protein
MDGNRRNGNLLRKSTVYQIVNFARKAKMFAFFCTFVRRFFINQQPIRMMHWRRLNGQRIEQPLLGAVEETLRKERAEGYKLKVCIGTDSQVIGEEVHFATVIVFLREKRGGFMFISNDKQSRKMSLRERMILEVGRSVEVAYALCELLDRYDVALEVHADINTDPAFESNTALKEAMGYILSMGFVFKAKPDAFASSSCADKVI